MSTLRTDQEIEIDDLNTEVERLEGLLTQILDGINDEIHPWFVGGEMGDAEREWEHDARKAVCWGWQELQDAG